MDREVVRFNQIPVPNQVLSLVDYIVINIVPELNQVSISKIKNIFTVRELLREILKSGCKVSDIHSIDLAYNKEINGNPVTVFQTIAGKKLIIDHNLKVTFIDTEVKNIMQ